MKKLFSAVFAALILISFSVTAFAQFSSLVISYPTPTDDVTLKYATKMGSGYRSAPTPPVVYNDHIYTVSGASLYKLSKSSGEIISSVPLQGRNFYSVSSPLIAENTVFIQLDGGKVYAFDEESLTPLWYFEAPLAGQALSPIVYEDKRIYTGFWNGETEAAEFVCIDTEDTDKNRTDERKDALWTYSCVGGFYKSSCAFTESSVIIGTDDGKDGSAAASHILSLSKKNGALISSLQVTGDIRCSISSDTEEGCFYTASKAGYIYKFRADSLGRLHSLQSVRTAGEMTATPVSYGNKLYAVSSDNGKGRFYIFDKNSLKELYSAQLPAYPQADMLISNAYEKFNGNIYIYFTVNSSSGSLMLVQDSKDSESPVIKEIFRPENEYAQYCISPVTADSAGTLYFKNDSGYIFALEEHIPTLSLDYRFQRIADIIIKLLTKIFELLLSGDLL